MRELDRLKLYRARYRLYRSQILQENMRWKALAEIYTMHSFAPFAKLNFFVKSRWFLCWFLKQNFAKFANFADPNPIFGGARDGGCRRWGSGWRRRASCRGRRSGRVQRCEDPRRRSLAFGSFSSVGSLRFRIPRFCNILFFFAIILCLLPSNYLH